MTNKIAALAAAIVVGSAVAASAQSGVHISQSRVFTPGTGAYESVPPERSEHQYCYLPSGGCDNDHTVTN